MSRTEEILKKQRAFFEEGSTLPLGVRESALKKLYRAIKNNEDRILAALRSDLGKGGMEAFMCEVGLALSEITHMLKNLKRYSATRLAITPITNFHADSLIRLVPKGNVLIMSPWNYPFLLTMSPMIDAIAAGNTVIVKPSAYASATSELIAELIADTYKEEYVACITGGRVQNQELLSLKFDHIFFTGSQAVGREVLRRAAEHLTPVTLELGGKSPCIVDGSANLKLAARRIVFGKFLNCGQTCVAPDYILCEEYVKDELIAHIKKEIRRQFGKDPLKNKDYGKIINEKHFRRILGLIDPQKLVCGGESKEEELRIAPTVMEGVKWEDRVMGEEIFGPVLPILTFERIEEVREQIEAHAHPLALYIFSRDKDNIRYILNRCRFGGGCINDVVVHLATPELPFGGFGESGMGAYHGKFGFETFSHKCSILDKKQWLDLPMRYQPYRKIYEAMLKAFLK
ncbi:MAG: aldehyde dehydrogenase [Lachnospiraceae bacterium]|nr:aldehyde dehydrogenase [Lachnospiraceae bacterium]